MKKKCFVIHPKNDQMKSVRDWLDQNGFSYSYDNEDYIIFANLSEIPSDLNPLAKVYDPVVFKDGKWFTRLDGHEDIADVTFENENEARTSFVHYISWSGEFVNNDVKS